MLDSPTQTPDAKGQRQSALMGAGTGLSSVSADIAMMIEAESAGGNNPDFSSDTVAASIWDNSQWRDDLQTATNKLQHRDFNPGEDRSAPPLPPPRVVDLLWVGV